MDGSFAALRGYGASHNMKTERVARSVIRDRGRQSGTCRGAADKPATTATGAVLRRPTGIARTFPATPSTELPHQQRGPTGSAGSTTLKVPRTQVHLDHRPNLRHVSDDRDEHGPDPRPQVLCAATTARPRPGCFCATSSGKNARKPTRKQEDRCTQPMIKSNIGQPAVVDVVTSFKSHSKLTKQASYREAR